VKSLNRRSKNVSHSVCVCTDIRVHELYACSYEESLSERKLSVRTSFLEVDIQVAPKYYCEKASDCVRCSFYEELV
jgi:hypothetical protein